jgi:mannose-6-phosphate isomerase-like protein (cupin superfamily)
VKLKTPTAGSVIVKADTSQTNGSMTVLEFLIPPNDGPAVHSHIRQDEVRYFIEGDFRFKAGDAMLRASTGGMAFGSRGVPHAFQNVGDALGRLLVITTPSGWSGSSSSPTSCPDRWIRQRSRPLGAPTGSSFPVHRAEFPTRSSYFAPKK